MHLSLSEHLTLPLDVLSQKLAVIGRSGSGKSYLAMKLTELLLDAHGQVVAVDPVGVWHGLRVAANGKDAGIAIPILGGQRGDIPLEPSAGVMIADVIVDRAVSMVLDVSEMTGGEQRRFIADFATRFLHRKKQHRSPVMLIWEESQEFVPQRVFPDAAKMVGAMERLIKIGRNFGIGTTLITQRPQAVNKDVLNQTEVLIVYQTTGPHERKAIEGWIVEHGLDMKNFVDELPHLPQGTGWLWSPQWLRKLEKIRALPRRTYDASATPQFSTKQAPIRALAPIDLQQIQDSMAATIEKAKADDPKQLRAKIAELQRELNLAKQVIPVQSEPTIKEVPVFKGKQLAQLESFCTKLMREAERHGSATSIFWSNLNQVADSLLKAIKSTVQERPPAHLVAQRPRMATKNLSVKSARESGEERAVSKSQQRILNALVWAEGIGLSEMDKTQLALMSDQRPTSGGYFNNLGSLRSAGLIAYPKAGTVALTETGRAQAEAVDVPTTSDELQQMLFAKLSSAQSRTLKVLIGRYPDTLSKDLLADLSDKRPTSGGYFNNLGRLRSLGLIDYPSPGQVVAQPVLFLDVSGLVKVAR